MFIYLIPNFQCNWEGAWSHHFDQTVEFAHVFQEVCVRNKDSIVARTSYGCSLCAESFAYRWWCCGVDHCTQTRLVKQSWNKAVMPPILFLFRGCVDAAKRSINGEHAVITSSKNCEFCGRTSCEDCLRWLHPSSSRSAFCRHQSDIQWQLGSNTHGMLTASQLLENWGSISGPCAFWLEALRMHWNGTGQESNESRWVPVPNTEPSGHLPFMHSALQANGKPGTINVLDQATWQGFQMQWKIFPSSFFHAIGHRGFWWKIWWLVGSFRAICLAEGPKRMEPQMKNDCPSNEWSE